MDDPTPSLSVYVPKVGTPLDHTAIEGSAIVGSPYKIGDEERVRVDYEGSVFGQHPDYRTKLLHAAGRHITSYPTVARMFVPRDDLMFVGSYDPDSKTLEIHDSAPLVNWLGGEDAYAREIEAVHA